MSEGESKLIAYFLNDLADRMANAGCNDMDQAIFSGMSDDDKMSLYGGFLIWDMERNPEDWEATKFAEVMDSTWVRFLAHKVKQATA